VLRPIAAARDRGVGVVFATHDPHHVHPVGDRFLLLGRGRNPGDVANGEVSVEELPGRCPGDPGLDEPMTGPERPPA
jgi:simple sugar transport system ATP-binding protein